MTTETKTRTKRTLSPSDALARFKLMSKAIHEAGKQVGEIKDMTKPNETQRALQVVQSHLKRALRNVNDLLEEDE